jgi:predicted nucleic-acid-binding protein
MSRRAVSWFGGRDDLVPPMSTRHCFPRARQRARVGRTSRLPFARLFASDMLAVDTNALVRLLVRDDVDQVHAAEAFVAKGAWVSHLVLAETLWVLDSVYELSRPQISTAVEMLLNHKEFSLQDADVVCAALEHYRRRSAVEFSDCLVLEIARKAGHVPVVTFDRNFAKLDGVQRLG